MTDLKKDSKREREKNIENTNDLVSHIIDLMTVHSVRLIDLDKIQIDKLLDYIENSGVQKIPNNVIEWLSESHPEVYKEFYKKLT